MRWSYKTVHYELTKEGLLGSTFLDESAVELSLNEYGKAGWELVSMLETMDGLIAIFKQPLNLESRADFIPEGLKIQRTPVRPEEKTESPDIDYNVPDGNEELHTEEDFALLDDFEIIEEKENREVPEPATKKDIGSIRIE